MTDENKDSATAEGSEQEGGTLSKTVQVVGEWIQNGKVPGAVKAVAHVIGATGEAGAAWIDVVKAKGERAALRVRSDSAAQANVIAELGKAAALAAGREPDVVERAFKRWANEQVSFQESRDQIAAMAIEHLGEQGPPPGADEVGDDWLNVFTAHAEKATTEALRQSWARILADEIRKPGTFSLQTLQLVAVLDKKLASTIVSVAGALINSLIVPTVGPYARGKKYSDLLLLDSVGFLQMGHSQSFNLTEKGKLLIPAALFPKPGSFALFIEGPPGKELRISGAILTEAGRELLKIIDYGVDAVSLAETAKALSAGGMTVKLIPIPAPSQTAGN